MYNMNNCDIIEDYRKRWKSWETENKKNKKEK